MSREESRSASAKAGSEGELHRPPSVLWFVIPLVGIVLYALLSR
jgi:hypothetical protein